MYRCLIIFSLITLSGCAHFLNYTKETEPLLPDTANLPCCWQALEQLEIEFQGTTFSMSSIIAVHNKELTVVILDPLGRRIFTVTQRGKNVQVEKSAGIKRYFPVKWLLIGIYLRYMPISGWKSENSDWVIKSGDSYVLLEQNKQEKVILTKVIEEGNTSNDSSKESSTARLDYPDLKLRVNITTLSINSL